MTKMDLEKLKSAIMAYKKKQGGRAVALPKAPTQAAVKKEHETMEKLGKAFLAKTGVDAAKMRKPAGQSAESLKKMLEAQRAGTAKASAEKLKRLQVQLADRESALKALSKPAISPFTPYSIFLNEPFLIWENPHPNLSILKDWHIVPFFSDAEVQVDYTHGGDNTYFTFYYFWENEAEVSAVIDVTSVLIFNGDCVVSAQGGVFSSDSCYLDIGASLTLLEWWNNPPTSPLYQTTQNTSVVNLSVSGPTFPEYLWENSASASQALDYQLAYVSYDKFLIPPLSSAVFEVNATFNFDFTSGGYYLSDIIWGNFAPGKQPYKIMNPWLEIDVLQGGEMATARNA